MIGICCGKCNAGKLCLVSELTYEEGCKYGNKGCFSCTLHLLFLLVTVITLKRTVGKPEESNCRNTLDNPHVKIIGKSRSDSYCKEVKHSRCCPGAYKYISDLIFAGHGYKQKLRLVTHLRNKYRCKYQREYAHENVPLIFFLFILILNRKLILNSSFTNPCASKVERFNLSQISIVSPIGAWSEPITSV